MADLLVRVTGMGALEETADIFIGGECRTSDMTVEDASVSWQAQVAVGALAATMNTAIKNAAVTAAGDAGHTVGALDKKNVLGGATGL